MFMKQPKSQKEIQQRSANEPSKTGSLDSYPPILPKIEFSNSHRYDSPPPPCPLNRILLVSFPPSPWGNGNPGPGKTPFQALGWYGIGDTFSSHESRSSLGRFRLTGASGTETERYMYSDMRLKLSRDMGTHREGEGDRLLCFCAGGCFEVAEPLVVKRGNVEAVIFTVLRAQFLMCRLRFETMPNHRPQRLQAKA